MVNMLNLWWTCSIYGEHALFMVNMLNLISWLDWPWKTTLKWPFECPNPSTVSKDTMKSAELYSQSQLCLTIGFALKNYPKMTLWLSKSVHWIKRYSDIYFEVSWFVQTQLIVLHDWIGLKKLPQNDSLNVQIRPLDQKIQWYLYWSQLICTVTADLIQRLDWPWKTTPKWLFECPNPSTGSKDTVMFILKSADLYSHSWFDPTIGLALKNYPKLTPHKLKSTH